MLAHVPVVPPHAVSGAVDCIVCGEAIIGGLRRRIFARVHLALHGDGTLDEVIAPQTGEPVIRHRSEIGDIVDVIDAISDPPLGHPRGGGQ